MASPLTYAKIDLISKALILCGETPLTSLSDNRYGATVGSNLFDMLFETELQANRWRFACNKKNLSRLLDTPLNEWQFAYQLPTDMLLPYGTFPRVAYEIYADRIYTNASKIDLEYQFKPEINKIPAYFNLLMTYALARDMIKPITESDTAHQLMQSKYNMQRNRALFADAQGRPNKPVMDSPFTDTR